MKSALETAATIGMSLLEFWELTPYELSLVAESYIENLQREYEEKVALAYMNALWTAQFMFGKRKPPSLEEILKKGKKEQKKMTPEQIFEEVKRMNAALGGTVY
ncbi:hypothetical protein [Geobacillus sp. FJAT-46040]|uniref:hypothetical protein n=1 Tax=Geobacillus sp. FJAT-46040 TaxID=2011017 RepID=UPI000BB72408|nr:hypothetical protein [Geobacillus sp. FJAT-46040]